ncbi:kinase-like domain-containing protein, partial [Thamnocephalis sphaerospora]
DYQLLRVLGNGSFGAVLEAQGVRGMLRGRRVAIKMIAKRQMASDALWKRVVNEVTIHLRLRHPAVLRLYDCFEDADHVYLVMELCTGGELFGQLHRNGRRRRLTEARTRDIMRQLISGLMYLHAHGVLHRDLKLSNVLLTADHRVKLGDFGLATLLRANRPDERRTLCGTPNYIAPEVLAHEPYGFESDIWSLGCILVALLTGRGPFEGQSTAETLDNIRNCTYSLPGSMSVASRDLARRFLQKDPHRRISLQKALLHPFF